MTEYELVNTALTYYNSALAAFGMYITVLSGYVIAAFVAGERLNRAQVSIVNVLLVCIATIFTIGTVACFSRTNEYATGPRRLLQSPLYYYCCRGKRHRPDEQHGPDVGHDIPRRHRFEKRALDNNKHVFEWIDRCGVLQPLGHILHRCGKTGSQDQGHNHKKYGQYRLLLGIG